MGIDSSCLQFLSAAKNRGVDFRETLTIGRQRFFPDTKTLGRVFKAVGVDLDPTTFKHEFAEPFFKALGAESVDSMDACDHERATIIHDLNLPIPAELRGRFSAVFDGGTLEHVFNFPQAIKNLMDMVRVGGSLVLLTSANNMMGHGFWQVSPELMYRCLSPENGFEVDCVLLKETISENGWYAAPDPLKVRTRVELTNQLQTLIMALARKTADVEVFAAAPQQSDYVALWNGTGVADGNVLASYRSGRRRVPLPRPVKTTLMRTLRALKVVPEFDPCYRRLNASSVIRGELG